MSKEIFDNMSPEEKDNVAKVSSDQLKIARKADDDAYKAADEARQAEIAKKKYVTKMSERLIVAEFPVGGKFSELWIEVFEAAQKCGFQFKSLKDNVEITAGATAFLLCAKQMEFIKIDMSGELGTNVITFKR